MSFCHLLQVIPTGGEPTLFNRFLRGLTDHCFCLSGIHHTMQQQCPKRQICGVDLALKTSIDENLEPRESIPLILVVFFWVLGNLNASGLSCSGV